MEAVLKKYFWLVRGAGVALVVAFAASALVNATLSKQLLAPAIDEEEGEGDETGDEDEDEDEAAERQQRMLDSLSGITTDTTASRKRNAADAVVSGSIFCPTCAPEPEVVENPSTSMAGPVRPGDTGGVLQPRSARGLSRPSRRASRRGRPVRRSRLRRDRPGSTRSCSRPRRRAGRR